MPLSVRPMACRPRRGRGRGRLTLGRLRLRNVGRDPVGLLENLLFGAGRASGDGAGHRSRRAEQGLREFRQGGVLLSELRDLGEGAVQQGANVAAESAEVLRDICALRRELDELEEDKRRIEARIKLKSECLAQIIRDSGRRLGL